MTLCCGVFFLVLRVSPPVFKACPSNCVQYPLWVTATVFSACYATFKLWFHWNTTCHWHTALRWLFPSRVTLHMWYRTELHPVGKSLIGEAGLATGEARVMLHFSPDSVQTVEGGLFFKLQIKLGYWDVLLRCPWFQLHKNACRITFFDTADFFFVVRDCFIWPILNTSFHINLWKWGPLCYLSWGLRLEPLGFFCSSSSAAQERNASSRNQNLLRSSAPWITPTMKFSPILKRWRPIFLFSPWTTLGFRSPLSLRCGCCWPPLPKLVCWWMNEPHWNFRFSLKPN